MKSPVTMTSVLVAAMLAPAIGIYLWMTGYPEPQEPAIRTIGVINYNPAAEQALAGLKAGLHALGYRENETVRYLYAGPIGEKDRLRTEAVRLREMGIDLFYTISTPATLAAKAAAAGKDIPVVFGPVSSPVKAGIVESMMRPGGNLTGVTFGPQEPKRLEMLLRIVPGIKRLFVPFNPDDKSPRLGFERLRPAAEEMGLGLLMAPLRTKGEVKEALEALPAETDGIYLPADSTMVTLTDLFVEAGLARGLPLTTPHREGVVRGALCSYGFSIRDVGFQAARLVDQIFRGARPADLPVELADFTLAVNLETAARLGVLIPPDMLRHALTVRGLPSAGSAHAQ